MAAITSESERNKDDSNDVVDDDIDIVGDGTWDMLHELNKESLFNDWASSSTSNCVIGDVSIDSNSFTKLFTYAMQTLYSGCKTSKLSFIIKLLHLKIINKWTNKSFIMYMHTLKGYVRNKARQEGSIAERYIDNECLTFVSMYIRDTQTKFTRPYQNCDVDHGQSSSELSIFQHKARGLGAAINVDLNMLDWAQIRWYVLNNCPEVLSYLNGHKEGLERDNVENIELIQLELDGCNIGVHDLKSIARGPDKSALRYAGCMINGHKFAH
ncbi:hypothetical protein FEM48_Zijuj10G0139700 [Ziziphus jujuba var. spinosa]|uniref:DUF4218 domain-containing protein n=1 Tax=Ziziphus jujuba var. spinosa TaxID=714518 RepID=A0A978UNS9_ZIZJJ|nr:hypothetical protein FEM48_Zijuj10G0139700 [Ziziphus jujuba var. spinosa]